MSKTIKALVKETLQDNPLFRERSRRSIGFATLIKRLYPTLESIEHKTLIEALETYASMERCWRQELQDNEDLRGFDYGDKESLEKSAQENLGYQPTHEFERAIKNI